MRFETSPDEGKAIPALIVACQSGRSNFSRLSLSCLAMASLSTSWHATGIELCSFPPRHAALFFQPSSLQQLPSEPRPVGCNGAPGTAGVVADATGRGESRAGVDNGIGARAAPHGREELHFGLDSCGSLKGVVLGITHARTNSFQNKCQKKYQGQGRKAHMSEHILEQIVPICVRRHGRTCSRLDGRTSVGIYDRTNNI